MRSVTLVIVATTIERQLPRSIGWHVVFLVVGGHLFRSGAGDGGALAIALAIHLDDGGVVDHAVDGGDGHGGITEHRKVRQSLAGSCLTSRSRIRGTPCMAIGSQS